ncbi:ankyrin repeat protein [Mycena floridula]|nr:ankyrin repeat protein [Mycena floridula]
MDETALLDKARLPQYNDAELHRLISLRRPLKTEDDVCATSVRLLSPSLVAKDVQFFRSRLPVDEVSALALASSIGIRVPVVHRVVPQTNRIGEYVIMDRVQGQTLDELWPNLGWWSTIKLAWQLRDFITMMRRKTSKTAGAIISGSGYCRFWDFDSYGLPLHASPGSFLEYMNWWLSSLPSFQPRPELELRPFNFFVFSHMDLHMRNMVVDDQQRLWIIDWGCAGFFPVYMERATMRPLFSFRAGWLGRFSFWRWQLFCWIATRTYYVREYKSLTIIAHRTTTKPRARQGFPSERTTREELKRVKASA